MAVMNVVWPVSALYFSVFAVWAYYRIGRAESASDRPSAAQIALATSHCGAGCALADVACEFAIAKAGATVLARYCWRSI